MKNKIDKNFLITFSDKIKKIYEKGKIKAPIHLSGNNEKQLIRIFKNVKKRIGFSLLGEVIIMHFYMELIQNG